MANSSCHIQRTNDTRSNSEATENPMYSILVINIAFSAFLCYSTTMMNVVTIYALMKTSMLSKPLKTLLFSLAVSDLGVGFLGFPFQIAHLVGQIRCKIPNGDTNFASRINDAVVSTLFMCSLSTIVAISVDRFIAIEMPLRYDTIMTHKRIIGAIMVIWIVSATFSILCYMFKAVPLFSAFVFLVIIDSVSFLVTTATSCKIYVTLRRHKKEMENGRHQLQQQSAENKVSRSGSGKSSSGTLLIYLFFWVCYLPHLVISIVRAIYGKPNTVIEGMFTFSETLVFFNSSINPVIFCWKMTPIRRTILSILRNTFLKESPA